MRSLYLICGFLFIMMFISDNNKESISTNVVCKLRKAIQTSPIPRHYQEPVQPIIKNESVKETNCIKILITSFGPYNEFDPNPSQVLMAYVQKHHHKKNVEISFCVLETSYEYCERWINHANINNYDLIIHTGVDGMAQAFELEKFATRIPEFPETDVNDNIKSSTSAFKKGEEMYTTKINLDVVRNEIKSPECVIVSEDAGAYLCNFIYYLSSYTAEKRNISTDILFVHVPSFENLNLQHQYPIFKDLLDCLIDYEYAKEQHPNK